MAIASTRSDRRRWRVGPGHAADDELIAACQRGDQRAWGTLVDRYARLVYAVPVNLGVTGMDAEDVAQATFEALHTSLDRLAEPHRVSAWLVTVARRQTFRVMDKRHREAPVEPGDLADQPVDSSAADRRLEDLEWVHQGLLELGERCRALLLALYFSGSERGYGEVADELGLPIGSIGPTRARCLAKLREHLGDLHPR